MKTIYNEEKSYWKMVSAKDGYTLEPYTIGDYPKWIGAIYTYNELDVGYNAFLQHICGNTGEPESGYLMTSPVMDLNMDSDGNHLTITTLNSIYDFYRVVLKDEDGE